MSLISKPVFTYIFNINFFVFNRKRRKYVGPHVKRIFNIYGNRFDTHSAQQTVIKEGEAETVAHRRFIISQLCVNDIG